MADALHQLATGGGANLRNEGITLFPIPGVHPHLDQLMMLQRLFQLIGYSLTETGIADNDDGLEIVGQFAKMTFLRFGK